MQADDLENLIADSIGGVQSALEAEKKASANSAPAAGASQDWASEAVKDLQSGPSRPADSENEEFFSSLVKTFQDGDFQKAMAEAMQAPASGSASAAKPEATSTSTATSTAVSAGAGSATSSGTNETGPEEFLQKFAQHFDEAVNSDDGFEKSLANMMTSMLSNDLICDPLTQISDKLEAWLKSQKGLPSSERTRYEGQLRMHRQILAIYRSGPDPLPEVKRLEVQRLMSELQNLGSPPEEILKQISPTDAEDGGESFEDFVKSMGLQDNLGSAEEDLLKKLSDDPEELAKVFKDMAEMPDEACKQQ